MSGFWSSLFGGANSNLSNDISSTAQTAGFATGMGEKNLTAGSNFFNSVLSGDSSKISQALAPEISAAKTRNSQTQKSNTEFGTRSGGTAASNAASSDKLHSDITNLVGNLTGSAASNLMSSGGSLLNTGLSATGMNADLSQTQMKNWEDSIFGKGITTAAAAGEAMALGA